MTECESDDFYEFYSACDASTGERTLTWLKKPTANCKGGFVPPEPVFGLPCGTPWRVI